MSTPAARLVLAADRRKVAPLDPAKPLTIGRAASNSLCLANQEGVSEHHAVVRFSRSQGWLVCNWQSSDGTYLEGRQVHQCKRLENGDEIRLGRSGPVLVFEAATAVEAAAPTAPAAAPAKPPVAPAAAAPAAAPPRSISVGEQQVAVADIRSAAVQSLPLHPHIFSWWLLLCLGGLLLLPFPLVFWPLQVGALAGWILLGSRKQHELVLVLRDGRAVRHSFANRRTALAHRNGIRHAIGQDPAPRMNWLLPEGASLPFSGLEQPLLIERGAGGGSQGQVFAVRLSGERLALKWYFPACIARDPQLRERLQQSIRLGAPNRDFLWPLALLDPAPGSLGRFPAAAGGFGYLMGLRPEAFVGAHRHAGGDLAISLQCVLKACFHLAEAFHQLHLKGLCYKDVSLGNLFLDPSSGGILICDNDNVDVDGQSSGSVLGTPGFMAPEVFLGQAKPSARSDLFSLAVLLFRLLTRHDPFRGQRELEIRCLDEPARRRLYGEEALFIFDPSDPRNRPDAIEHSAALITWPIYPASLQRLFEQSFGPGLRQSEQRTLTGQWKQAISLCLDQRQLCSHCGQETFPVAGASSTCWSCGTPLPAPLRLEMPHGLVSAAAGNELQPHHFDPLVGESIREPLARLVAHPSDPTLLGLQNLSTSRWSGRTTTGQSIELDPGKTCNLAALQQLNSSAGAILVQRP